MHLIPYLVCSILFLIIGKRVYVWQSISRMGYESQTPLVYLKHSKILLNSVTLTILTTLIFSFIPYENLTWSIGKLILFIIILIYTGISGRSNAIKQYRQIQNDFLIDPETEESFKEEIKEELKLSDTELFNKITINKY